MGKRTRHKPDKHCTRCNALADEMFRVKYRDQKDWILVCKACQLGIKGLEGYLYGGTWKQAKRQ